MNELSALPDGLNQTFWLLVGLFWFLGTRIATLDGVREQWGCRDTVAPLLRRLGVFILVFSLVIWAIQLSSDRSLSPIVQTWPALQKGLAIGAAMCCWFLTAVWILLAGGVRTLADAFDVSPGRIRALAALFLIAILLVNIVSFAQFGPSSKLGERDAPVRMAATIGENAIGLMRWAPGPRAERDSANAPRVPRQRRITSKSPSSS